MKDIGAGLCGGCRWARRIRNRRGSEFVLCRHPGGGLTLPKYPRLPVLDCQGYEPYLEEKE